MHDSRSADKQPDGMTHLARPRHAGVAMTSIGGRGWGTGHLAQRLFLIPPAKSTKYICVRDTSLCAFQEEVEAALLKAARDQVENLMKVVEKMQSQQTKLLVTLQAEKKNASAVSSCKMCALRFLMPSPRRRSMASHVGNQAYLLPEVLEQALSGFTFAAPANRVDKRWDNCNQPLDVLRAAFRASSARNLKRCVHDVLLPPDVLSGLRSLFPTA